MTDRLLNIQVPTPQTPPPQKNQLNDLLLLLMSATTRRLVAISSCPEAKGLPSCSSCESSSPEVEGFKVTILGVAVGNYMKMHYSDMGWYIGSI